jgi:hypothetical protein
VTTGFHKQTLSPLDGHLKGRDEHLTHELFRLFRTALKVKGVVAAWLNGPDQQLCWGPSLVASPS